MQPLKGEGCAATSENHSFDSPYPSPPPTPCATSSATTTSPPRRISSHFPSDTTKVVQATPPTSPKAAALPSAKSALPTFTKSSPPSNSLATLPAPEPPFSAPNPTTSVDLSAFNDGPAAPALRQQTSVPAPPILTSLTPLTDDQIKPARPDAVSSPLSPVISNDTACSDYGELSFQGPHARSDSALNVFEALLYHGILASTKVSRDSKVRVARVLKLIRSLRDGNPETDKLLITRKLTSSDYEQLIAQIAKDQSLRGYFNDKLRFDYTHEDSELVIRMPGPLHEFVAGRIHDIIVEQRLLFKQRSGTSTALLARSIETQESTDVEFPTRFSEKTNKKSPDKSYGHQDCLYPALVIEIAWSQRRLDLPVLAKRYIQRSKGGIRTVVGVKIEYQHTTGAKAHFLVWYAGRPNKRGVIEVNSPNIETIFRDEKGQAVPAADLRLLLTDFVCSEVARSFTDVKDEIVISSTELCDILARAEKRQFPEGQATQSTIGSTSRATGGGKASANNAFSRMKGVVTRNRAKGSELRRSERLRRAGDTEQCRVGS